MPARTVPLGRRPLLAVASLCAAGLVACGGSDGGGKSGPELQGSALATKLSGVCSAGKQQAAAVQAPANPDDLPAFYRYLDQVADIDEKTTGQLAGQRAGGAGKAALEELISARRRANDVNRKIADAAQSFANESGEKTGTEALEDVNASLAEQAKIAKELDPLVARINTAATTLNASGCQTKAPATTTGAG